MATRIWCGRIDDINEPRSEFQTTLPSILGMGNEASAEPVLHGFGHKPVAGVMLRVHAKGPSRAAACCAEDGVFFFQSSQCLSFRNIAQSLAALAADAVLEVENVVASLAGKEFHIRGISYGDVGLQAHPQVQSSHRQALR
jgi:hypothetical protein